MGRRIWRQRQAKAWKRCEANLAAGSYIRAQHPNNQKAELIKDILMADMLSLIGPSGRTYEDAKGGSGRRWWQ
jgi:hypothetical protein